MAELNARFFQRPAFLHHRSDHSADCGNRLGDYLCCVVHPQMGSAECAILSVVLGTWNLALAGASGFWIGTSYAQSKEPGVWREAVETRG